MICATDGDKVQFGGGFCQDLLPGDTDADSADDGDGGSGGCTVCVEYLFVDLQRRRLGRVEAGAAGPPDWAAKRKRARHDEVEVETPLTGGVSGASCASAGWAEEVLARLDGMEAMLAAALASHKAAADGASSGCRISDSQSVSR